MNWLALVLVILSSGFSSLLWPSVFANEEKGPLSVEKARELLKEHHPHHYNDPKDYLDFRISQERRGGRRAIQIDEWKNKPTREQARHLKIVRESFNGDWVRYFDVFGYEDQPTEILLIARDELAELILAERTSLDEKRRVLDVFDLSHLKAGLRDDLVGEEPLSSRLQLQLAKYLMEDEANSDLEKYIKRRLSRITATSLWLPMLDENYRVEIAAKAPEGIANYVLEDTLRDVEGDITSETRSAFKKYLPQLLERMDTIDLDNLWANKPFIRLPYKLYVRAISGDESVYDEVVSTLENWVLEDDPKDDFGKKMGYLRVLVVLDTPRARKYLHKLFRNSPNGNTRKAILIASAFERPRELHRAVLKDDKLFLSLTPDQLVHIGSDPFQSVSKGINSLYLKRFNEVLGSPQRVDAMVGSIFSLALKDKGMRDLLLSLAKQEHPGVPPEERYEVAKAVVDNAKFVTHITQNEWASEWLGLLLTVGGWTRRDIEVKGYVPFRDLVSAAQKKSSDDEEACVQNEPSQVFSVTPILESGSKVLSPGTSDRYAFEGRALFRWGEDGELHIYDFEEDSLGQLTEEDMIGAKVTALHTEGEDHVLISSFPKLAKREDRQLFDIPIRLELWMTRPSLNSAIDLIGATTYEQRLLNELNTKDISEIDWSDYVLTRLGPAVEGLELEISRSRGSWDGTVTLNTSKGALGVALHEHEHGHDYGEQESGTCPVELRRIAERATGPFTDPIIDPFNLATESKKPNKRATGVEARE